MRRRWTDDHRQARLSQVRRNLPALLDQDQDEGAADRGMDPLSEPHASSQVANAKRYRFRSMFRISSSRPMRPSPCPLASATSID